MKFKFRLNENIEWHCMHLELNSNKLNQIQLSLGLIEMNKSEIPLDLVHVNVFLICQLVECNSNSIQSNSNKIELILFIICLNWIYQIWKNTC